MQSVIQGESIDKMAKRMSEAVATSDYKAAVRYARTMTTNTQNAGRYEGYRRAKGMGVDLTIEWSATLDNRTRHDHRLLHGQRRGVDEPFEVDNVKILYPAQLGVGSSDIPQSMIWNCRCTLLAWVKGFEGETVKSSPKMGDMTFEEWQEMKEDDPRYKAEKYKKGDQEQYADYKKLLGKDAPKSFGEFQQVKYNDAEKYAEWKKQAAAKRNAKKALDNSANDGIIVDRYRNNGLPIHNVGTISEQTISVVREATRKIANDFPVLPAYTTGVFFGDIGKDLAVNRFVPSTGRHYIELNASWFSNPSQLLTKLHQDFLSHESYDTDYIESLVAHEIGHACCNALALKRAGLAINEPLSDLQLSIFLSERQKITEEIYEAAFTNEDYITIQAICGEQYGYHVIEKPLELVAQGFGNYYYGKQKFKTSKRIVRYFKKELL